MVAACVNCTVELTPARTVDAEHPTATHVCAACGKLYDVTRDPTALVAMNGQAARHGRR